MNRTSTTSQPENQQKSPMTKCAAMLTLKLSNPDYSAAEVQAAYNERMETIEKHEKLCVNLVRTFKGSPNEIRVRQKAIRLKKDKVMVRLCLNLSQTAQSTPSPNFVARPWIQNPV